MNSIGTICLATLCLFAILSTGSGFPQESADQVQSYANTLCKLTFLYLFSKFQFKKSLNSPLVDELPEESYQAAAENLRLKRATCDLLSGLGVNDSACAAHCIARGNRGGYCNAKKVCVCRN